MLMINHSSYAQSASASSDSRPRGIPSGTWSGSRDETSSRSTRQGPGFPGQWSPDTPTNGTEYRYPSVPTKQEKKSSPAMPTIMYETNSNTQNGYGGKGVPAGSWSGSRDEYSSESTRKAPGPVGPWSPQSSTGNSSPSRNLQASTDTSTITTARPTGSVGARSAFGSSTSGSSGASGSSYSTSSYSTSSGSTSSGAASSGSTASTASTTKSTSTTSGSPSGSAVASSGTSSTTSSSSTSGNASTQTAQTFPKYTSTTSTQPTASAPTFPKYSSSSASSTTAASTPQPTSAAPVSRTATTTSTVPNFPKYTSPSVETTTLRAPVSAPRTATPVRGHTHTATPVRPATNATVVRAPTAPTRPASVVRPAISVPKTVETTRNVTVVAPKKEFSERKHRRPVLSDTHLGPNVPECDIEDLKAAAVHPTHVETKKVDLNTHLRPVVSPPTVEIHVHDEKCEHEEPIIIEKPVYIEKPVFIEVPAHREYPHVQPVSLKPTPPPVREMPVREPISKKPLVVEPFIERPAPREEVFVAPIRVPQAKVYAPEPKMEAPVFTRPIAIELPPERPVIIEEPMFFEPAIEPIHFERPMIDLNINPNNPGIIFGIDEEVEIERCFYEEVENWSPPEYAEVVEEAIVNTPYGPKVVRGPAVPQLARPPLEHSEVLERCMHKVLIAPTMEIGIKIPQVRYVTIQQVQTGTFEWPIVRRAQVFPQKTLEKTVEIPQLGFVELCQDHPTNETAVSIPQVHTVFIEQIVKTNECTVSIPQVHTIWIPIMGDVNIVQHRTKSRRVFLRQEWDCTIKCEDTRVHFIKIPQKDLGITGTVIKNVNDENANICYNCHNSKCAGVGPAFNPFLFEKSAPVVVPVAAPVPVPAPAPEKEIVYVEVPGPAPEPIIKYETIVQEPTYIHHIQLGMCPCAAVAVNQPVQFLETPAAVAGWPWWYWLLLALLALCLL